MGLCASVGVLDSCSSCGRGSASCTQATSYTAEGYNVSAAAEEQSETDGSAAHENTTAGRNRGEPVRFVTAMAHTPHSPHASDARNPRYKSLVCTRAL